MNISFELVRLTKRHPLTISRGTATFSDNLLIKVTYEGITGWGEVAPLSQGTPPENAATASQQLTELMEPLAEISPHEMQKVERLAAEFSVGSAALCALDVALHDWVGKKLGCPVYRLFGMDLMQVVPSSVTIGINPPEIVRERVAEVLSRLHPRALKIKLGSPDGLDADRAMFAAVREIVPEAISLRVDANGGWPDLNAVDGMLRWLASNGVEYVEQPLARGREDELLALYRQRPLPIYVDESCWNAGDVIHLADRVDGVNLKLLKAGGLREGLRLIHAARACNLRVMIGCMSESMLGIAAGASLSPLADYLDLDSHINLLDDPFSGLMWNDGRVTPNNDAGLGINRSKGEQ